MVAKNWPCWKQSKHSDKRLRHILSSDCTGQHPVFQRGLRCWGWLDQRQGDNEGWGWRWKAFLQRAGRKSCAGLTRGLSVKCSAHVTSREKTWVQSTACTCCMKAWRMTKPPLTSARIFYSLGSKLQRQQPSSTGSCSSVVIFRVAVSMKCCVHNQRPFTFSYSICPIHKAAYWTYTPLPMFRAIKTCSRTQSCSHNPTDFHGWDEGSAQSLSACSL